MRTYKQDRIKLLHNQKTGEAATIDVMKGCPGCELKNAPCYAAKMARVSGVDFFHPVEQILDEKLLSKQLSRYEGNWIRIGCISDPSLDWGKTLEVCKLIHEYEKISVIVTKIYHPWINKWIREEILKVSQLQVSLSALMSSDITSIRLQVLSDAIRDGYNVVARINSAVWKEDSKPAILQRDLIEFSKELNIPILETPIRLFKTSPIWNLVDQSKYHKHISPISGKEDSQSTAGLIIPGAYACYSTCSPIPTENDPVGCPHQCCTIR